MHRNPYEKICHLAKLVRDDGAVSALCSPRPHPINLRRATWTNRREAVTCPKCRRLMAAMTKREEADRG